MDDCLSACDDDDDGALDFEEFKKAISRSKILLQAFWKL